MYDLAKCRKTKRIALIQYSCKAQIDFLDEQLCENPNKALEDKQLIRFCLTEKMLERIVRARTHCYDRKDGRNEQYNS